MDCGVKERLGVKQARQAKEVEASGRSPLLLRWSQWPAVTKLHADEVLLNEGWCVYLTRQLANRVAAFENYDSEGLAP
jgi:hypothetical protein